MTPHDADAIVADWLADASHRRAPATLLDDFLRSAAATPQRPAWRVTLRGPTPADRRFRSVAIRVGAAGLALVLVAAILAQLGTRVGGLVDPTTNGSILVIRATATGGATYLTMGPDGAAPRVLLASPDHQLGAFWSPDGTRVLVPEVLEGGRIASAIVQADGAAKHVLPPDATLDLAPGAWMPDGAHVLLAGWDDRDQSRVGLYLADDHGGDRELLTTSADGRRHDVAVASFDGRYIAFLALDPPAPIGGESTGTLMVVAPDGTGQRPISPATVALVATSGAGRPFDWSPDGRHLAYAATERAGDVPRSAIFVADVNGGDPIQVTDWGPRLVSVDWSPEADWILTGDAVTGAESIWRVHGDGRDRQDLWTAVADPACCGVWSPDGRVVLFQRGAAGARDLWVMDPDGVVQGQLTHDPGAYVSYAWAPDAVH